MLYPASARPKTQRIAKEKLGRYMQLARLDDDLNEGIREIVPQAWHRLEHDIDVEEPKVKITLRFRGREMAHQELGMKLLQQVKAETDEVAKVESEPKLEGRQMVMVLAPR